MTEPVFRPSRPGDETALRHIWKAAFDDPDSFIELFFHQFYTPGMASVAEVNGEPVSAGYTFSGLSLSGPGLAPTVCSYGYSIGTLPEYRGQGLGGAVTRWMRDRALQEGHGTLCLSPAEAGLRDWYARIAGGTTAFWIRQLCFSRDVLPPPPRCGTEPLSPGAYGVLREQLLADMPHMRFPELLLKFQDAICRLSGGGLYALGGFGCAIVEYAGTQALVKELLLPRGGLYAALSLLAQLRPVEELVVRIPCSELEPAAAQPSVMALCQNSDCCFTKPPSYWGPVFD
jgi:GNAT superfamily N-acetyltransferase